MIINDQATPITVQTTPTPQPTILATKGTTFRMVTTKSKIPFRPLITITTPMMRKNQSHMLLASFSASMISSPDFLPITRVWKRLPFFAL